MPAEDSTSSNCSMSLVVSAEGLEPAADDVAGQIEKLCRLHDSGSLSYEEFADAKRKLLEYL